MAIYATDKGTVSVPAPEGTHIARCIQVIDIGSHKAVFDGDERTRRKVRIAWELPTELHVFDPERGEEPFVVSKEYNLSTNEKSNLRRDLESWRGKQFDAEEAKKFDVSVLIGVPAMLSVVHADKIGPSKGKYAKISAVTRPPKTMTCPKQVLASIEYSVDQGRNEVFKTLPEWMRKKIEECEEWRTYPSPANPNADPTPADTDSVPAEEDSVPF
jgi:hypothetical protein